MANAQWETHSYPLKRITIQLQGTRHSDLQQVIQQLDEVKAKLIEGYIRGKEHDDDYGYLFVLDADSAESVFDDEGCGSSFSRT